MIWQSQGGGPWGGGPRGGGPWGGGPRNNGGGPGPRPRGPYPPDFEEWLRRGQDRVRRVLPGGFGTGTGIAVVLIAIVLIWLASGFYRVLPDEVGIVLRFGAYNRTTQPGLNYHLPSPIESVLTPSVTRVNRTEIGYRSGETQTLRESVSEQVPEEALMLTGDENIVDVNFTVFWVIKDAKAYLFNIRDPELTVKSASESAMREVIGETPIAQALAEGRAKIEAQTQQLLQTILDSYGAGIEITQLQLQRVDPPAEVIDAFRDVQAALADRARLRNEAESYRNSIIPRARGDAVRIEQEAEAYRLATIARSTGDAARFLSVYHAFKAAQDVTLQRLYLETMEEVLKNSNKVIIDKSAQSATGVLPYLPLPALGTGGTKPAAPPAEGSPAPGAGAQPAPQTSDTAVSAPPPGNGQD
ncbi:MAG TPA: FtsH protease activity modulator HflK [Stellaceae bacterium]|jgi:membrane protease subunit HflK|nr:FtsH protease activity modulator HflK [Stellaceae bacterium]